jgi:hypothetical protein
MEEACQCVVGIALNPQISNCRDDPGMFNRGLLKVNAAKKTMGAPSISF